MANKSQRRFDARRFRGSIGPGNTSALSERTVEILCPNVTACKVEHTLFGDSM